MALTILFKNRTGSTWSEDFSDALSPTGGTYAFNVRFSGYTATGPREYAFDGFSQDYGWTLTDDGSTGGEHYTEKMYTLNYTANGSGRGRGCGLLFHAAQEGQTSVSNSIDFSQAAFIASIEIHSGTSIGEIVTGRTIEYNDTDGWYIYIGYYAVDTSTLSLSKSQGWITAGWYPQSTSRGTIYLECSTNTGLTSRSGVVTISSKDVAGRDVDTTYTITQSESPIGSITIDWQPDPEYRNSVHWDDEDEWNINYSYDDIDMETVNYIVPSWVDVWWDDDETKEQLIFVFAENDSEENRTATITVQGNDIYGHTLSATTTFTQLARPMYPIWKDVYYTGATDTLDYYINDQYGNTIYQGVAYVQPGQTNVKINISKICQDYLSNRITDGGIFSGSSFSINNYNAIQIFHLYKVGQAQELAYYIYRYDWSYNELPASDFITNPINGHLAVGMKKLGTVVDYQGEDEEHVDYNCYKNSSDSVRYTSGYCGDYALYYCQRNGGWAAFLIEGNVKKSDNYNKYVYNLAFNNTKAEFEEKAYHNEIVSEWEMHTGWLTDEESENLVFNLLPSNQVFLHNLKTNKVIPVTIQNSGAEYLTFKNNGRKMISYTINLRESQCKQML